MLDLSVDEGTRDQDHFVKMTTSLSQQIRCLKVIGIFKRDKHFFCLSDKDQSFVKSYFRRTAKKVKQTAVFVTKPKWRVRAVVTVFSIMKQYLFCKVFFIFPCSLKRNTHFYKVGGFFQLRINQIKVSEDLTVFM